MSSTALAAINAADVKPFRLVFSGGTALSRAHRLIRRMSEDIDLKIVSDEPRSRPELRKLRDTVTSALLHAGFQFDPENAAHRESGNASRYTVYRLPYTPQVTGEGALRPEIKIETAVWPLRLPSVERSVTSFWAEAFKQPAEVPSIPCVATRRDGCGEVCSVDQARGSRTCRRWWPARQNPRAPCVRPACHPIALRSGRGYSVGQGDHARRRRGLWSSVSRIPRKSGC